MSHTEYEAEHSVNVCCRLILSIAGAQVEHKCVNSHMWKDTAVMCALQTALQQLSTGQHGYVYVSRQATYR